MMGTSTTQEEIKEQFDEYKVSYLFRLIRSYEPSKETKGRIVLKSYPGNPSNKLTDKSKSTSSNNLNPKHNETLSKPDDTAFDKEIEAKENEAQISDKSETTVNQKKEPDIDKLAQDETEKEKELANKQTEQLPEKKTYTQVVTIPKTISTFDTKNETDKQSQNKPNSTDSIVRQTAPVTKLADLNEIFQASEWLIANARENVYLDNQFNNMVVKKVLLTNIEDNSENYIPLDRKTFHLLRTLIIGNDSELYFIFNDSNSLSIAPKHWLDSDVNIEALKEHNYKYAYHDLDLKQLLTDLKPFVAEKVNGVVGGQKYMQLWFKYVPIAPAK